MRRAFFHFYEGPRAGDAVCFFFFCFRVILKKRTCCSVSSAAVPVVFKDNCLEVSM